MYSSGGPLNNPFFINAMKVHRVNLSDVRTNKSYVCIQIKIIHFKVVSRVNCRPTVLSIHPASAIVRLRARTASSGGRGPWRTSITTRFLRSVRGRRISDLLITIAPQEARSARQITHSCPSSGWESRRYRRYRCLLFTDGGRSSDADADSVRRAGPCTRRSAITPPRAGVCPYAL